MRPFHDHKQHLTQGLGSYLVKRPDGLLPRYCFKIWYLLVCLYIVSSFRRIHEILFQGEELTLDYEYDPNNCPAWFSQALDAFLSNVNEEQLQNISKKYKDYHEFLMGNQNGIS